MGPRIAAFLGAINGALLLRLANEDDAFVLSKSGTALVGDFIFTLALQERNHRDVMLLDVALNRLDEAAGDRFDHGRRGYRMPTVDADELQNPFHCLQDGHIDVEVHPVDPL